MKIFLPEVGNTDTGTVATMERNKATRPRLINNRAGKQKAEASPEVKGGVCLLCDGPLLCPYLVII